MALDLSSRKVQSNLANLVSPSGAIVDLDARNASTILEYPPVDWTTTTGSMTLTTGSYGNGSYIASASTQNTEANYGLSYYAFESTTLYQSVDSFWGSGVTFNSTTGSYTGSVSTLAQNGISYSGEWLQLQVPQAIKLNSFTILPRQDASLFGKVSPRNFVLLGSNDGNAWNLVYTGTDVTNWSASTKTFTTNSNTSYLYFRLIVSRVGNNNTDTGFQQNAVQIARWRLFGTPSTAISGVPVSSLGTFSPPSVVQNGLIAWFDPANAGSYSGSGASLYNLIDGSALGTLGGTYNSTTGGIRLVNNSLSGGSNFSRLQLNTLSNVTTVSLWYYQHSTGGTSRILLDGRVGAAGGLIANSEIGSNWTTGTLYKNGGSAASITWANIETIGSWQNITVIANASITDDLGIFTRTSGDFGLDVTFGPILIYNRAITQTENESNFNAIRSRYNLDGGNTLVTIEKPLSYATSGFNNGSYIEIDSSLYSEFPPANITSGTTIITGQLYGNGEYSVSARSDNYAAGRYAYNAFNDSGIYQVSTSFSATDTTGDGYVAYHVTLKSPTPFILKSYSLQYTTSTIGRIPQLFRIYGSNNNSTWTVLDDQTSAPPGNATTTYNVNNTVSYYVYKFAHKTGGDIYGCDLARIRYYGYHKDGNSRTSLTSATAGTVAIATNRGLTVSALVRPKSLASVTAATDGVYPPVAMTANSTSITGATFGNGTYVASNSSNNGTDPLRAFDKNSTTGWSCRGALYDNSGNYLSSNENFPPAAMTSGSTTFSGLATANGTYTVAVSSTDSATMNRQYPPIALTSTTDTVSNQSYGNGIYTISRSMYVSGVLEIFDGVTAGGTALSGQLGNYDSTTGNYIGSTSTIDSITTNQTLGEWVEINLPESIILNNFIIYRNFDTGRPLQWVLFGSPNGSTWTKMYERTSDASYANFWNESVNTNTAYSYYRIVFTKKVANSGSFINISEFQLFEKQGNPYQAFDRNTSGSFWISAPSVYNTDGSYAGSSTIWSTSGEWIYLQAPTNYTPKSVTITCLDPSKAPNQFNIIHSSSVFGSLLTASSWSTNPTQTFSIGLPPSGGRGNWGIVVPTLAGTGGSLRIDELSFTQRDPVTTTDTMSTVHSGEWVQLQLPNSIYLKSFNLTASGSNNPTTFALLGSINGSTWDLVYNTSLMVTLSTAGSTFLTNNANLYNYFRLVVKSGNSSATGNVNVYEMSLTQSGAPQPPLTIFDGRDITGAQRIHLGQQATFIHPLDYVSASGIAPLVITETNGESYTTVIGSPTFTWDTSSVSQTLGKTSIVLLTNGTTFGNKGTMLTYQFIVPTFTTYNIQLQVLMPNANNDSFWVSLDGGAAVPVTLARFHFQTLTAYSSVTLSAGTHTLTIQARETGALGGIIVRSADNKYYGYSVKNEHLYSAIYNGSSTYPQITSFAPKQSLPVAPTLTGNLTSPTVSFDVRALLGATTGNTISQFSSFTQGTLTSQPTYNTVNNPYNGLPYLSFNRTASQHLARGSTTLNIQTNGGFTALALARFTGTAGKNERILDFNNGLNVIDNNVLFARYSTTQNLIFNLLNSSVENSLVTTTNPIVQNEWAVFACRYTSSSNFSQIFKNNVVIASTTLSNTITNKTLANNFIGRSYSASDAYSNIDIAALYIYDRALSDADMTTLYTQITTSTYAQALQFDKFQRYTLTYNDITGAVKTYINNNLIGSDTAVNVYPPQSLITAGTVTLSGALYGNGAYITSRSTTVSLDANLAFDKDSSTYWSSSGGKYDINGVYYGNNEIFPPAAMTSGSTTFSGLASANGTYSVSVSSTNTGSAGYLAMDRSTSGSSFWESATGVYDTTGSYIGTSSIWSTFGEWVYLTAPTYSAKSVTITCLDPSKAPATLYIINTSGIATGLYTAADWTSSPTQTFVTGITSTTNYGGRTYWGVLVPTLAGTGGSLRIDEISYTQIDPITTTNVNNTVYKGEWLQVQLPVSIALKRFGLVGGSNSPTQFTVLGSTGGSTWNTIFDQSSTVTLSTSGTTFTTNSASYFNYFRLVIKSVQNNNACRVYELNLFGTEQITNKTLTTLNIGKSLLNAGTTSDLDIADLKIYDRELTLSDLQTISNVASKPKVISSSAVANVTNNGIGIVSLDPKSMNFVDGAPVAEWNGFSQSTASRQPIYRASGGYNNGPYLEFKKGSKQFLSASSTTNFAMGSNGGFTIAGIARFPSDTPTLNERIVELNSQNSGPTGYGSGVGNLAITRAGTDTNLKITSLNIPSATDSIAAVSTWTTRSSVIDNNWNAVAWAPELGLFVAVAGSGTGNRVITSPDGISWTTRVSAADNQWRNVCWAPELGLFCATADTGSGNRVMTSNDGVNWTTRTTNNNNWLGVCWSGELSLFVVVAWSGTGNRVMTSPDGINWTTRASAADNIWWSVCWSPQLRLFCAVGETGNCVMTSPDGIAWTTRTTNNNNWNGVCWAPELGLFCAVATTGTGNRVMTSSDGINWTTRSSAADNDWRIVSWAPELKLFCAVGVSGTGNRIMTSPDGLTWSTRASAVDNAWRSITWAPELGIFAAVSQTGTGNRVMTSTPVQLGTQAVTTNNLIYRNEFVPFAARYSATSGSLQVYRGTSANLSTTVLEYPPVAMTANNSTVTSASYGNGTYSIALGTSYGYTNNYKAFDKSSSSSWVSYGRYDYSSGKYLGGVDLPTMNMTSNSTTITGATYVNGLYTVSSSSGINPYYAFDGDNNTFWQSSAVYDSTTGSYIGSTSTTAGGVVYSGEWIQLQLPQTISVGSIKIIPHQVNYASTAPRTMHLLMSTNGVDWTLIETFTNLTDWTSSQKVILTTAYQYNRNIIRLVISDVGNNTQTNQDKIEISDIKFSITNNSMTDMNNIQYNGEYVALLLPNAIALNTFKITSYSSTLNPTLITVLGSNDSVTWKLVYNSSSSIVWSTSTSKNFSTNNKETYKYFAFIFRENGGSSSTWVGDISLFSSLTDRTFTQMLLGKSSGEIYSNMDLAGLWMYDRVLSDRELIKLYNTITTGSSPDTQLTKIESSISDTIDLGSAVLSIDAKSEAARPNVSAPILEYPPDNKIPGNITQTTGTIITQVSGADYGNGTYTFAASSVLSTSGGFPPTYAFESTTQYLSTDSFWHTPITYATTGSYLGTVTTIAQNGTSYSGEWIQIGFPQAISLSSYSIFPRQDASLWNRRSPNTFVILGSNDGVAWNLVNSQNSISNWTSSAKTFIANSSVAYRFYRMVISVIGNSDNTTTSRNSVSISRWRLYGSEISSTSSLSLVYPPSPLTANSTAIASTSTSYAAGTYTASASTTTTGSAFTPFGSADTLVSGRKGYWESAASFNSTTGGFATAATTWVTRSAPDNSWMSVCWSPELSIFVAVGQTGTGNRVMTSSDGINWVTRSSAADNQWRYVIWISELSLFVTVSSIGNVMTSNDGIVWTLRTTPVANSWQSIAWSPELRLIVVVGVSGTGNRVMTSNDGINWVSRSSAADNNWEGVEWSSQLSLFVAVGVTGTGNRIMTSNDGIVWVTRSSPNDNNWSSIVWSSELGLFVATAWSGSGNRVMTSSNGITWVTRTTNDNGWIGVIWVPQLSIFVAVAASGTNRIMTSPDGITWTARSSADNNMKGITYSPQLNLFVTVAYSGTGNRVMTSGDLGSTSAEYLQLQLPKAIQPSSFTILPRQDTTLATQRSPRYFLTLGSTNGTNWDLLYRGSDVSWSTAAQKFPVVNTKGSKYSYFRLLATRVGNSSVTSNKNSLQIAGLTFEELITSSAPNVARAILPSQVQQAEPAKVPRLITPTTILEFPPQPLTANTTTITTADYSNGIYTASASATYTGQEGDFSVFKGFESFNLFVGGDAFWNSDITYSTTGSYTGTVGTTAVDGSVYSGEWIQLQLPQAISLRSFAILPRSDGNNFAVRSPNTFVILGSNDNANWNIVGNWSGVNNWTRNRKTFPVQLNTNRYTHFRLVTSVIGNTNSTQRLSIARWQLYGTLTDNTNNNYLAFSAAKNQSLSVPSKVYDIATGGGFTALAKVRLGAPSLTARPQKIFDLGTSNSGTSGATSAVNNLTMDLTTSGNLRLTSFNIPSTTDAVTAVTTWTTRTSAADNQWISICWSPELSLFAAVSFSGSGNRIMTSNDGVIWTTRASSADNNWRSITWSPELSLFVAVSDSGTNNRVMTSPDGVVWTTRSPPNGSWWNICWSAELSLFVVTGNSNIMTSPDGLNWTTRTTPAANLWYSVTWSPQLAIFVSVAVSGTGNRVMTSSDGITWTTRSSPVDNDWRWVVWSPSLNLFAAVAQTGTGNRVMTSPDGIIWTTRSSAADNTWQCVTWSKELSLFVAVASAGNNRVMTSPDGITWTTRPSPVDNQWLGIAWSPQLGTFAAVAQTGTGNRVMTTQPIYKGINVTSTVSVPVNQFLTIGARYIRSTAVVALDSRQLSNTLSNGQGVYDWSNFYQQTSTARPTYISSGGYNNNPYLTFNRTNSQFLNGGTRTLNIQTNGGFTALALVRFTGTVGANERIFDFSSGTPNDNLAFARNGTTGNIFINSYNSTSGYQILTTTTNPIVQDEWAVFGCRHNANTSLTEIFKNGGQIASATFSAALTDRTVTTTFIGRAPWAGTSYTSMDIAGLYVYDRALSNTEFNSLTQNLLSGSVPLTEIVEFSVNGRKKFVVPTSAPVSSRTVAGVVGRSYTGSIYPTFSNMDLASLYLFDRALTKSEIDSVASLIDTQSESSSSLTRTTRYTPATTRIVQVPPATSNPILGLDTSINNSTQGTFTITDTSYGNGTFVVTSSAIAGGGVNRKAYTMFLQSGLWQSFNDYDITTGFQITNKDGTGTGYFGAWIKIELPYLFKIQSYLFGSSFTLGRTARDFALFGSNDNTNWIRLNSQVNVLYNINENKTFTVSNALSYKNFMIVVNRIRGNSDVGTVMMNSIRLYGIIDPSPIASAISARYLKITKPSSTPQLDSPRIEVVSATGSNVALNAPVVSNATLKNFVSPTIASPLAARNYTPITSGLIAWFDPNDPLCYSGTGATMSNLVIGTSNATFSGTYSSNNGTVRLVNFNNGLISNFTISSLTNIRTVSMWFYKHTSYTNEQLLDVNVSNSQISSAGGNWIGTNWSTGTLYYNGGISQGITWTNVSQRGTGGWHNVTVISNVAITGNLTIFGRSNTWWGMDVTFGPILIYNRAITQAENETNFNAVLANYFSTPNPTLPITNGLTAWFDPSDTRCYPGSGATLGSLVMSGTTGSFATGTLSGTYSYDSTSNGIRLVNTLQLDSLSNITTVSIWYKQESIPPSGRYLLDGRIGGSGAWIYNGSDYTGTNWTTGTLYKNGGTTQSITWDNIYNNSLGTWQNITLIANTPFTDDLTLFGFQGGGGPGLDVTFGPILIYNRALTESENRINYEIMNRKLLARASQKIQPSLVAKSTLMYPPVSLTADSTSVSSTSTSYGSGTYNLITSSTSGTISADGRVNVDSRSLSLANGASVSSWNGFTQGTVATQPVYYSSGGFNNMPFVRFTAANSQRLEGGLTGSFNIQSNGGFTVLALFKFNGPIVAWERIFGFNDAISTKFLMARQNTTGTFYVSQMGDDNVEQFVGLGAVPVDQNAWTVISYRFNSTTNLAQLFKNNVLTASTTLAGTFGNITITNSVIGRFPTISSNSDISGLYVYDRALSDADLATAYNNLTSYSAAWNALDGSTGTVWSSGVNYNTSTGAYAGTVSTTDVLGNTYTGEYLQIKTPEPLYLTGISVAPNTTSFATSSPTSFSLLGSSNGIDYTAIMSTTASFSTAGSQLFSINGTSGTAASFDNYRLITSSITPATREYPPSAMTVNTTNITSASYGNGTYIASMSNATGSPFWNFDDSTANFVYSNAKYDGVTGAYLGNVTTTDINANVYAGEYIQLQMPNAIRIAAIYIAPRSLGREPALFTLLGSTDGSSWNVLYDTASAITWTGAQTFYISNISSASYYRLVCRATVSNDAFGVNEISFIEANEGDVSLSEVQLFGGTINSTRSLQAFPPAAMTANTTAILNTSYGAGTYIISASSQSGSVVRNAFDNNINTFWHTAFVDTTTMYATTGNYIGTTSMTAGGIGYAGEWIGLQTPNLITVDSISIAPHPTPSFPERRSPNTFYLFGSRNGSTWELVKSFSNVNNWTTATKYFTVSSTRAFNYFRLLTTVVGQSGSDRTTLQIAEWKLYGREFVSPIREFPPGPMSADTTTLSGYPHGEGSYNVTPSSLQNLQLTSIRVLGNDGGTSINSGAAGGGGATQVGSPPSGNNGGNGGEGYSTDITGTTVVYGSGGGGGRRDGTNGIGGTNAGSGGAFGTDGINSTGSGGGGGEGIGGSSSNNGGLGGSGIVVIRYDTTLLDSIIGSGGTTTTSGKYRIHQFTTTGGSTFTVTQGGKCDILIVGGGGGGGSRSNASSFAPGGGGGGGKVIHLENYTLSSASYSITVGSGGNRDSNGSNSSFDTVIAIGGGSGGESGIAGSGGSGGGGGRTGTGGTATAPSPSLVPNYTLVNTSTPSSGWVSSSLSSALGWRGFDDNSTTSWRSSSLTSAKVLGNNGGSSTTGTSIGGGGGGGAIQAGTIAIDASGAIGGEGYSTNITGTTVIYGSGGGGGSRFTGGGNGGTNAGNGGAPPTSGIDSTGGGGGGGQAASSLGGNGGSGIVVVRYNITDQTNIVGFGGTTTTSGNFIIHQFTSTGGSTFTVSQGGKCDLLIVGGGGGGGKPSVNVAGGGGGGGKVIHLENYNLIAGTYSVTVGAGGLENNNGSNSSFDIIVALGGGAGGSSLVNIVGNNGGSGGGGGRNGTGGSATAPSATLIPGTTLTNTGTTAGWISSNIYSSTSGSYLGTTSMTAGNVGYAGEWLQLQMPSQIRPTGYTITPNSTLFASRSPSTFYLFGSNDNVTYSLLDTETNINWASSAQQSFPVSTSNSYNYFRLLTTVVGNSGDRSTVEIVELSLFGDEILPSSYTVVDLGADTSISSIRLINDTTSTTANLLGSSLSMTNSAGTETYTRGLDSQKDIYTLLDTTYTDGYSTTKTPFSANFLSHNESAITFDSKYNGSYTNDSAAVPFGLRKTRDTLTLQVGSQSTSGTLVTWSNAIGISSNGGLTFGDSRTALTKVFEGTALVGTGNANVNSFTITLPQTLANSSYLTFITPEIPTGTEVFFCTVTSKTTSSFVVNVTRSDAQAWTSALTINWKVLV